MSLSGLSQFPINSSYSTEKVAHRMHNTRLFERKNWKKFLDRGTAPSPVLAVLGSTGAQHTEGHSTLPRPIRCERYINRGAKTL